ILNVRFILFVTPLRQMYVLKLQRFLVQGRSLPVALPLPSSYVGEVRVVASGLTLRGLAFGAKVATTGLRSVQGVVTHQLGNLEEVCHPSSFLQRLVQFLPGPKDSNVLEVLFTQFRDFCQRLLKAS